MKNISLFILLFSFFSIVSAQNELKQGNAIFKIDNSVGDIQYYSKDRYVGTSKFRLFAHTANNSVILNYDNDFSGGFLIGGHSSEYLAKFQKNTDLYQIELNGKTNVEQLYLNKGIFSKVILRTENDKTTFGKEGQKLFFGNIFSDDGREIGEGSDLIYMTRYNWEYNKSDLRIIIGDDKAGEDRFIIGSKPGGMWSENFVVLNNGKVGINGVSNPTSALEVNGTIRAKEVKIESTGWADFAFNPEYKLPTFVYLQTNVHH